MNKVRAALVARIQASQADGGAVTANGTTQTGDGLDADDDLGGAGAYALTYELMDDAIPE